MGSSRCEETLAYPAKPIHRPKPMTLHHSPIENTAARRAEKGGRAEFQLATPRYVTSWKNSMFKAFRSSTKKLQ